MSWHFLSFTREAQAIIGKAKIMRNSNLYLFSKCYYSTLGDLVANNTYSTVASETTNVNKKAKDLENFYWWLCGFTDGEGLFYIKLTENETNAAFSFKISLHLDDSAVLEHIKNRLGFGCVYFAEKSSFVVFKQKDLKELIKIFSNYTLNSTKYLNFIAFKKAFELYTSKKKNQRK